MLTITVNPSELKALLCVAGKNDIRTYLNAVCIDLSLENAAMVATNGNAMLAIQMDRSKMSSPCATGKFIIGRDLIEAALKGNARATVAEIEIDGGNVSIKVLGVKLGAKLVGDRYFDWRMVVPKKCSGDVAQFDPALLSSLAAAAKHLGENRFPPIAHNGNDGALIRALGYAVAVVMPIRNHIPEMSAPSWVVDLTKVAERQTEQAQVER